MSRLLFSIFIFNCTIFNCHGSFEINDQNFIDLTTGSSSQHRTILDQSPINTSSAPHTKYDLTAPKNKEPINVDDRPITTSNSLEDILNDADSDDSYDLSEIIRENIAYRKLLAVPQTLMSGYNYIKNFLSGGLSYFYSNQQIHGNLQQDLIFSDEQKKRLSHVREAVSIIKNGVINERIKDTHQAADRVSKIAFSQCQYNYQFYEIAALYMILLDSDNDEFNRTIFYGFKELYKKGTPHHSGNILIDHFRCLANDLFFYSLGRKQETCSCYANFDTNVVDIEKTIEEINTSAVEMIRGRLRDFFGMRGHGINSESFKSTRETDVQFKQTMLIIDGSKA